MKLSEQIIKIEKDLENAKNAVISERSKGFNDALYFLNYNAKGFHDGTADILINAGIDGQKAYALSDQIYDLLKTLTRKREL